MKVRTIFDVNGGHVSHRKLQLSGEKLGLSSDAIATALKNLGAREVRADFESGWALPGSTRVPKERQPGAEAPTASATDDDVSVMPGSRPLVVTSEAEAAAAAIIAFLPANTAHVPLLPASDKEAQEPAPEDDDPEAAEAAAQITRFLPRRRSDEQK